MAADVQIDVTELKFLQTRINGPADIANVCYDFRGNEQLLPWNGTLLDGQTQFGFRVVDFRAVQVIVPQFYCRLYRLDQVAVEGGIW